MMHDLSRIGYVGESGGATKCRADKEITDAKKERTDLERAMNRLGTETFFWIMLYSVRPGRGEKRRRWGKEQEADQTAEHATMGKTGQRKSEGTQREREEREEQEGVENIE